jgi:hypothetical protein
MNKQAPVDSGDKFSKQTSFRMDAWSRFNSDGTGLLATLQNLRHPLCQNFCLALHHAAHLLFKSTWMFMGPSRPMQFQY